MSDGNGAGAPLGAALSRAFPAEAKPSSAAAQLVDVMLDVESGLITLDEGAAKVRLSALDLEQLMAIPAIQQAFLAGSAQSKGDGRAIRRHGLALTLRLMERMSNSVDRLDDEDLPRWLDTVTRVLAAMNKTTGEQPQAHARPFSFRISYDPRGIEDVLARGLTVDLPGLTDEMLQTALANGSRIVVEMGSGQETTTVADPADVSGSL